MRKYETLYVLRPDLEAEKTQELVERFKEVVTSHGGELDEVNEWGKRRLAYEIDKLREGYYVLMRYHAGTDFTKELERLFRISDDVMRYITTRVDEAAV
ncbi:MAG: 30S ribosomal protein S6 [Firmicutes bacterium]|nr:30S ribosomal protein S6 [Bacillota bacterium]